MTERREAIVGLIGMVVLFLPIIIACVSGKHWKAAQEKERKRRLTDAMQCSCE